MGNYPRIVRFYIFFSRFNNQLHYNAVTNSVTEICEDIQAVFSAKLSVKDHAESDCNQPSSTVQTMSSCCCPKDTARSTLQVNSTLSP